MSTIYLNYFKNLKYFRYIYSSYYSIRNKTEKHVFYLTTIFLIVYIALLFLHENYLKYRYKDFFTHMLRNSKKDSHP